MPSNTESLTHQIPSEFTFQYAPVEIIYGRGCATALSKTLQTHGWNRSMVVCGSNVAANTDVMEPIKQGLGDNLQIIFDQTTPNKRLKTVLSGVEIVLENNIDVLIAVGGGSSLNVARAICSIAPLNREHEWVENMISENGVIPSPDEHTDPLPSIVVPTTLAGADLSPGGSIYYRPTTQTESTVSISRASISDARLRATAAYYDPLLFASTPKGVLASSAMNGIDKGIETLYARSSNPIAEAHAFNGLRYFSQGLLAFGTPDSEEYLDAIDLAVVGAIQVQYGKRSNVIHAFGNGISSQYPVQQGAVHAIMAPHVLASIFEHVDGHRSTLATAFGIDVTARSADDLADAVVDRVTQIRDTLALPTQLREIDSLTQSDFDSLAVVIESNSKLEHGPSGYEPTVAEIRSVLEAAW